MPEHRVWNVGLGVASLDCFTTLWARHGIDFDFVEAWEPTTDPQRFFKTDPAANPRSAARRGARYSCQVLVPAAWISREPSFSREGQLSQPFLPTIVGQRAPVTMSYSSWTLTTSKLSRVSSTNSFRLKEQPTWHSSMRSSGEHHVRTPVRVSCHLTGTFDSDACHRTTVSSYGTADASVRSGVRCG